MRIIAAVLLALLVAAPVAAQDGWPTHAAIAAHMTLQGADLATSMYLLGARRGTETNPVLAPFSNNPAAFGAVKMGLATASSYGLLRIHRARPRLAFWLAVSASVAYSGIVAHNVRLLHQQKGCPC